MADTVDLGSTASAWGFESLQVHHLEFSAYLKAEHFFLSSTLSL